MYIPRVSYTYLLNSTLATGQKDQNGRQPILYRNKKVGIYRVIRNATEYSARIDNTQK